MRRNLVCTSLCAIASMGIAGPAFPQGPTTRPAAAAASEAAFAECLLVVSQQEAIIDDLTLSSILRSAGVLGEAAKEILGPDRENSVACEIECRGGQEDRPELRCAVTITITSPDANRAAMEVMIAAFRRLESALAGLGDTRKSRLQSELDVAQRRSAEAGAVVARLRETRQRIAEESGLTDLSSETLQNRAKSLDETRQELEVRAAGLRARRQALQEQISQIGNRAVAGAGDEIAQELQHLVDLRAKELERVRELQKAGVSPEAEVRLQEEQWTQAKIAVLNYRREASQTQGGELLGRLNVDLAAATIDAVEVEARLQVLTGQAARIGSTQSRLHEIDGQIGRAGFGGSDAFGAEGPLGEAAQADARVRLLTQQLRDWVAPKVHIVGAPQGAR